MDRLNFRRGERMTQMWQEIDAETPARRLQMLMDAGIERKNRMSGSPFLDIMSGVQDPVDMAAEMVCAAAAETGGRA